MENKALLWFKPEKLGWLLLRRSNLDESKWKKLHCMIKGNKLYYIRKLNRPEPTGVLPLEGGLAKIAHHANDEPNKYCFVIIMKNHINENKVHIHSNYLFAAETMEDCLGWVDAINMAAIPTHIARLKLELAQKEVKDLMIYWASLEEDGAQKEADSNLSHGEENPLVLQVLVNKLMELYHSTTLAEQSKIAAQKQLYATHSYIAKLQQATMLLEEEVKEKHKALIQKDVNIVNKSLKHLMFLRCSLRGVAREIKVLDGNQEYGPEVPIMASSESILKATSRKLKKLREKKDFLPKKGMLPDEGEIWKLCEQINNSYKNERTLLQKALPKENLEFTAQEGRHRLTSYALVPPIENETKGKEGGSEKSKFDGKSTSWWSYKSIAVPLENSNNKGEENQNLQNLGTKSLLLPHLQGGTRENSIVTPLPQNEDTNKTHHNNIGEKNKSYRLKEDKSITQNEDHNQTNVQSTSLMLEKDLKIQKMEELDQTLEKEFLKQEDQDTKLLEMSNDKTTTLMMNKDNNNVDK